MNYGLWVVGGRLQAVRNSTELVIQIGVGHVRNARRLGFSLVDDPWQQTGLWPVVLYPCICAAIRGPSMFSNHRSHRPEAPDSCRSVGAPWHRTAGPRSPG